MSHFVPRALLAVLLVVTCGGQVRDAMAGEARGIAASPVEKLNVNVQRVEVTGITVFQQPEIEEAVEIGAGEKLDYAKVVRTAENIQTLYRLHGYEQVGIKSKLKKELDPSGQTQYVLEIGVDEGLPTRVADVSFVPEALKDKVFEKYWGRMESDLRAKAAILPGSIFDQEKITSSKRALQEAFAGEEFVGARVDDVRVETVQKPAGATESAGRWVKVEFHIDLGDRVSFGYRGNRVFTSGRLAGLVDEQRLLGLGKDYIAAIQSRIEDAYREEGYANVKVVPYSFERPQAHERHVTYVIEEGPRVQIDAIEFDGNQVFSSEELRKRFYDLSGNLVARGYYVEKDVQRSAELLVEWIKSKGYLASKLITINSVYPKKHRLDPPKSSIRLIVYLYEGDQTLVHSVKLKGVQVFSADEAKEILGVKENDPLNLFAFSQGIESLKQHYRSRGYLDARIVNEASNSVVTYSQDNRSADVLLEVEEGPRFTASQIQIEGLSLTKDYVVRRELTFKEGDVLEEGKVAVSEANLRRLGIFSSVTVRVLEDPSRPTSKIVRVSLTEGTPGLIAGGPGFRNDLGLRAFGEVSYTNLWGRNHTLSLGVNVNHRLENFRFLEYSAQLAYLWPWFGIDGLNFRPAITASEVQYINFDAQSVSLTLTFEKRLLRNPNLTGAFTYSLERVNQFNSRDRTCLDAEPASNTACVDNQNLRIGSITPSLRLDLRDNPLSPTNGLFVQVSDEIAQPWLLSQTSPQSVAYNRFLFRADYLFTPIRDVTWFFSFRTGIEYNLTPPAFNEDGTPTGIPGGGFIPLIKQFALGGANSLRGYIDQELNIQDFILQGYASYVNYRTQLDLPFSGALRFGPFLDAANLNRDTYSFGNLEYGAGFGFHYATPVGPVNLDWGFKLNPKPGTDTNRIYFSIGVI